MGYDHPNDTVRIIFCAFYFVLGSITMVLCLIMYRHDQRNKRPSYIIRYQSYINTISLLASAMWVISIGKLLPVLDILENKTSRYGFWISYSFYINIMVICLCSLNRLTIFGIVLSNLMTIFSSISIVFLSYENTIAAWSLFSSTAGLSIIFAHFFVWWKSNRFYTSKSNKNEGIDYVRSLTSYWLIDKIILMVSTLLLLLVITILILSDEVTDVIGELASEILNCVLILIHWTTLTSIIFFWFMDIKKKVKVSYPKSKGNATNFDWSKDTRGPAQVRKDHNIFETKIKRKIPNDPFEGSL